MPASVVIECPHCRTRYQVPPDTLVPAGRKVQCAHCSKSWMQQSKAGDVDPDRLFDPAEETQLDAEFTAEAEAAAPPPPPRKPLLADPQALPPEIQRSIEEIKAAIPPKPREVAAEPPAPESPETPAPPVVITLLDAAGQALYEWSVNPDAADLRPGEMVNFTSQLSAPPAEASRVRLTFANGRAPSETPITNAVQAESPAE